MFSLFALFCALQAFDAITTIECLKLSNRFEANPVMRKLFSIFGATPTLIIVKLAVCIIIGTLILLNKMPMLMLGVSDICYMWVVYNNIKELK